MEHFTKRKMDFFFFIEDYPADLKTTDYIQGGSQIERNPDLYMDNCLKDKMYYISAINSEICLD